MAAGAAASKQSIGMLASAQFETCGAPQIGEGIVRLP